MFEIQLSNPNSLRERDLEDTTLNEAIQSIFSIDSEYAFIIWNRIFIPVSYKYDISIMIDDLIDLYKFVTRTDLSEYNINWISDTFLSKWVLKHFGSKIIITSEWLSVHGKIEKILNENNTITVEASALNNRIKKLLQFIKNKLLRAGYNKSNIEDFYKLDIVDY